MFIQTLDNSYSDTKLAQPFISDKQIQFTIARFTEQGRQHYYETSCELLDPLSTFCTIHEQIQEIIFRYMWCHVSCVYYTKQPDGMDEMDQIELFIIQEPWTFTVLNQAFQRLAPNGNLILYLPECTDRQTIIMLWILFQVFELVELIKPRTSPAYNLDKFVCARTFHSDDNMVDKLKILWHTPLEMEENIPLSWFVYIPQVEKKFTDHMEIYLCEAINLCQLLIEECPFLSITDLLKIKKTCHADAELLTYTRNFFIHNCIHFSDSVANILRGL